MDHGQFDPGLAAVGLPLIVLAQSPTPPEPGERPLHDPPPLQHLEARFGPLDNLQANGTSRTPIGYPGDHPLLDAVSPHQSQSAEPAPDSLEHQLQTLVVLDIGGVY